MNTLPTEFPEGPIFIETLLGERSKIKHLDGAFLYPDYGIGMIAEKMAEYCGRHNIHVNTPITRIHHDGTTITHIESNGSGPRQVSHLVSTIPLDIFLRSLVPAPPEEILNLAKTLTYRNVILTAFTIHKKFLSRNASTYFPSSEFPFSRIYEPKQRSPHMAPSDKTSLVAEISCAENDPIWTMPDAELRALVEPHLLKVGWCTKQELGAMVAHRMPHAYPVQDIHVENTVHKLHSYCSGFSNLQISGRNGRFSYIHIHDLIRLAREVVASHHPQHVIQSPAQ